MLPCCLVVFVLVSLWFAVLSCLMVVHESMNICISMNVTIFVVDLVVCAMPFASVRLPYRYVCMCLMCLIVIVLCCVCLCCMFRLIASERVGLVLNI